jgi:hypothetical protein
VTVGTNSTHMGGGGVGGGNRRTRCVGERHFLIDTLARRSYLSVNGFDTSYLLQGLY